MAHRGHTHLRDCILFKPNAPSLDAYRIRQNLVVHTCGNWVRLYGILEGYFMSAQFLTEFKRKVADSRARVGVINQSLQTAQAKLETAKKALEQDELAQAFLQQVAKETQEQLKFHLQDLVQTALDTVFPATYTFKIDFVILRGRTEAQMYLDKDGERVDPETACGGGVVDVLSLALRIAAWSIGRTAPLIILDEPFKFLSQGLRPLMGEILRGLIDRLGVQIIMVTHDPDFVSIADRTFTIDQRSRKSFVASIA